jgi:tetratricopeptide (TPR) repeat protein
MQYNQSIGYFNKVLAVDPKNEDILKEEAKAYQHLHDYSREITYYNKALAVNPKDKDTQSHLANAKKDLANAKMKNTIGIC